MSVERAREQEIGRDMEMTRETRCRRELESVVPQRVGKQRERLHASVATDAVFAQYFIRGIGEKLLPKRKICFCSEISHMASCPFRGK